MATTHGGIGHPEEVLADLATADILGDVHPIAEEAVRLLQSLLAVLLAEELTEEEELVAQEEVHDRLTIPLGVVDDRVGGGGGDT